MRLVEDYYSCVLNMYVKSSLVDTVRLFTFQARVCRRGKAHLVDLHALRRTEHYET